MRRNVRRLARSNDGAVAPTVALSLVALIAAGGIAFDYARMAALDTELQSAADQAALAAAGQLDGESGACSRAVEAARTLLTNDTRFANDGQGLDVTISDSTVCDADQVGITDNTAASIRFFTDKAATDPANNNGEARYVQVTVDTREARYALTPIVGALSSGDLKASARAGLGTALCKVPPLMVCPPSGAAVDWNALRGHGIRAVSNSGPTWSPGNFGFLGPNDANSTQIGMAFENPVFQCQQINGSQNVNTGGETPAIVALNTRFDIYGMSGGTGNVLTPCLGSACPPALNVTKDLIKSPGGSCGTRNGHNNSNDAWHLPTNRFRPVPTAGTDPMRRFQAAGQAIDAMGLPRDNMHYCSSYAGGNCPSNLSRFGDGVWARGDYFNRYHTGRIPSNAATMTRYETYLWEIQNKALGYIPSGAAGTGTDRQYGAPVCNSTVPDSTRDRRVLTVAVASNCSALRGSSVPAQIDKWVEMFLVEPGVAPPGRGNGDGGNEIYLEIIREVDPGGQNAQVVRRDVPFLVR